MALQSLFSQTVKQPVSIFIYFLSFYSGKHIFQTKIQNSMTIIN